MNLGLKSKTFPCSMMSVTGFVVLLGITTLSAAAIASTEVTGGVAADLQNASPPAWDQWVQNEVQETQLPLVQNRLISKTHHVQLMAPLLGLSNRNDFYVTYLVSFAGRYHFSESHAWEFLRVNFSFPSATPMNTDIQQKTSYRPDVQLSNLQLGTSYIYTPIYGKYAWGSDSLVYFDIFGTAGLGVRFANDTQPFFETGIGMNHYLFSKKFAIVPEYRLRVYSEQRTVSTVVLESIFQVGGSWLF